MSLSRLLAILAVVVAVLSVTSARPHRGGKKEGGKKGCDKKKCRVAAHSWSKCKGLVEEGTCAFLQTEFGGVCVPGKREHKRGGKRGGKHGGKHGEHGERPEHGEHDRHGEHDSHGEHDRHDDDDHQMQHNDDDDHEEHGEVGGELLQEQKTVDPAFESHASSTDGQWSGPDFEPEDWFGPDDHGRRHHRGRHHLIMSVLLHALTFILGVLFTHLRNRFCPRCCRCCCCRKKELPEISVVPTVVVVSDKKLEPAVPSPRD